MCPVVPTSANTTSTSPTVLGLTAKVVRAVPELEVRLPTALMTTDGTVKVNWSAGALMADVPPGVVTVTFTVDALSAGEVMVMDVEEFTTRPVPATVPNFTAVAPVKPVPVTVTVVPPAVEPEVGLTPVTVGTGGGVKVN